MYINKRLRSTGGSSKCAVCGRKHGATYNFKNSLQAKGIDGTHATVECMRKLNQQQQQDKPHGRNKVLRHSTGNG